MANARRNKTGNKKVAAKISRKQERPEMIARSVAAGLFAFFILSIAYWQAHNWLMEWPA
jgi:arginyl-tRNA synthetase